MGRKLQLITIVSCALVFAGGMSFAVDISKLAGYEHLTQVSESGQFTRASECGGCHKAIYREWSKSPHAGAYVSPTFKDATDAYRFTDCLGCHAPVPGLTDEVPDVRTFAPDGGVTCVSCHLKDEAMWGPLKPTLDLVPHAVKTDPARFSTGAFCGRCHEGTAKEWQEVQMNDKPSCQECHMPPVNRKMAGAKNFLSVPFAVLHDKVDQRKHTFDLVPTNLDEPSVAVEAQRNGDKVSLTVFNHLPHSLPPGDFGVRVVVIEVFEKRPSSGEQPLAHRELFHEGGRSIAPRSSLHFEVTLPPGAASLFIRLTREGRAGADRIELLSQEVPVK